MKTDLAIATFQKVYIMTDGIAVKVGISADPNRRRHNVRGGRVNKVSVVREFETSNPRFVERLAHSYLSPRRLRGEWFNASSDEAIEAVEYAIECLGAGCFLPRPKLIDADGNCSTCHPIPMLDEWTISILQGASCPHSNTASYVEIVREIREREEELREKAQRIRDACLAGEMAALFEKFGIDVSEKTLYNVTVSPGKQ